MKNFLGNVVASIYFIAFILPSSLILWYIPINLFIYIYYIMEYGLSGFNVGLEYIVFFGLIFGISMLVPTLRRIYKKLPWLYTYIQIFMVNILILTAGAYILNFGFEVYSPLRQTIFFFLMVATIIIGRLAMCFYYRMNPIKIVME